MNIYELKYLSYNNCNVALICQKCNIYYSQNTKISKEEIKENKKLCPECFCLFLQEFYSSYGPLKEKTFFQKWIPYYN